tara:strand:- start:77 stop:712 length:636 start_codon:yes stop_codon:yes gene_type:complete
LPNFNIEKSFKNTVIGLDEVGRGTLAGPVVSCACVYFNYISLECLKEINDSKLLTKEKRKKALKSIIDMKKQNILNYTLGSASVEEIDKINILNATILSMKRALKKINIKKATIIVDGNIKFNFGKLTSENVVEGDKKSISIATASIIAKVYRDNYMIKIGKNFPYFKWEKNSGYGTIEHMNQIQLRGITKHHRRTFRPIKNFIQNNITNC